MKRRKRHHPQRKRAALDNDQFVVELRSMNGAPLFFEFSECGTMVRVKSDSEVEAATGLTVAEIERLVK